jgi:hypothetical protein
MKPAITLVAASKLPSLTCHIRAPNGLRSRVERVTLIVPTNGCSRKNSRRIVVHDSKSIASKANAAASEAMGV